MTDSQDAAEMDIARILKQRRQIAIIWGIEDVEEVRPDLNKDQAWEVLQACEDEHDASIGLDWDLIELIAEKLFPTSSIDSENE